MSTTTQLMTAEELLRLPDDSYRHELVKGELLTMPLPGEEHGAVIMNIAIPLGYCVKKNSLGVVYAETGFQIERNPDTVLGPDTAFVRRERVEKTAISKGYRFGAPDLVVEVNSPRDNIQKIERKIQQWLSAGAQLVWSVDPKTRTVTVYEGPERVTVLGEADELTGGDVVPGFRLSVTEVFVVLLIA
jgi:Uma2 family endonuclease